MISREGVMFDRSAVWWSVHRRPSFGFLLSTVVVVSAHVSCDVRGEGPGNPGLREQIDKTINEYRSDDSSARKRAQLRMVGLGNVAIPHLERRVMSEESGYAAMALAHIGTEEALETLIRMVNEENASLRTRIALLIALREFIGANEWTPEEASAFPGLAATCLRYLVEDDCAWAAAALAGTMRLQSALPVLRRLTNSGNRLVRIQADLAIDNMVAEE